MRQLSGSPDATMMRGGPMHFSRTSSGLSVGPQVSGMAQPHMHMAHAMQRPPSSPGAEEVLASQMNKLHMDTGRGGSPRLDGKGGREGGRQEGGKGRGKGSRGGRPSREIERAVGLAFAVQEVLDNSHNEPGVEEMQKMVDNLRMAATSEGHNSSEIKQLTVALEDKIKRCGLAREVGELIMANEKNGMRRYEGIHDIVKGLYLSGMSVLQGDGKEVEKLGITAVLSLTDFTMGRLPGCVKQHERIHVADSLSADLTPHFKTCVEFIHRAISSGQKVLVHCVAGVSRSASICIAYLMTHHQLSLEDARKLVKKQRPCTRPNESFISQLEEYSKTFKMSSSITTNVGLSQMGMLSDEQWRGAPSMLSTARGARSPLGQVQITAPGVSHPGAPPMKHSLSAGTGGGRGGYSRASPSINSQGMSSQGRTHHSPQGKGKGASPLHRGPAGMKTGVLSDGRFITY